MNDGFATRLSSTSATGLALLAAVALSACSSPGVKRDDSQTATAPVATVAPTPSYPGVPLTGDLLYELLVGEIAGARGQVDTGARALFAAAKKTRDPRLAARASALALNAKDQALASAAARLWVELEPQSTEAQDANAEALLHAGRLHEARAAFEHRLAATPAAQRGHAYLRIAAALGRHGDRAAALEVMRGLVSAHTDVREAHFALAHLTVRMGDLPASLAAIERALALAPGWEEAAVFKARVLVSQKDNLVALKFFENYLNTYPRATTLRLNYARYLIDLKQWNKARLQFKRVAAETPQDADALYAVGLLALQANQYDEAKKYIKANLELQPGNDQGRLYLGQIAEEEKSYAEAARWYGEVQGEALQFEAQTRLALLRAAQGDVAGARAQLHAIQPQGEQQRVQLVLSEDQVLRNARQFEQSLQVLNAALEHMPDEADLLYARALVAERLNNIELHEADLRKVLAKDPKNAHALNALGYTLADRTTRYEEAHALIKQALELKPDDAYIMDSMGWVHYRMGNNAEAIKYLKRAFSIRNDAEISAHLGEVLWVTGDRAAAESVWRAALKDTPDNEALLSIIKKFNP